MRLRDFFRLPSSTELAHRQLEEAQVRLVENSLQLEFYQAMVIYNQKTIRRLEAQMNQGATQPRNRRSQVIRAILTPTKVTGEK